MAFNKVVEEAEIPPDEEDPTYGKLHGEVEQDEDDEEAEDEEEKKVKQWIKIQSKQEEAYGDERKLLLSLKTNTNDLRKAISKMTGVPVRYVAMKAHGKLLEEAFGKPLESNWDVNKDVISWYKTDRLQAYLDKRKLPTINNLDRWERWVGHFITIDGDFELTKEVVDDERFKFSLINKQDIFGDSCLHLACICGYTDLVELFIDKQANPELQNIYHRTPLMLAAEHGFYEAVKPLLRADANIGPNPGNGVWK